MRANSTVKRQSHAFAQRSNPQRGGKYGGNMQQARPVNESVVHGSGQLQGSSGLVTDIHESLGG